MKDPAWKKRERSLAKFFGCYRNPLSGRNSRAAIGDVIHPHLVIECKLRKRHAAVRLWDEAKTSDKDKLPVVALAEHNRPGFWLLVHSDDLLAVAAARRIAMP